MPLPAAIGTFLTLKSFANSMTSILDTEGATGLIKLLTGIDLDPNSDAITLDSLHETMVEGFASVLDGQQKLALDMAMMQSQGAAKMLNSYLELPTEELRASAIRQSENAMISTLNLSGDQLRQADTPAEILAAVSSVASVVAVRMAVAGTLEDGAWARSSIREDLMDAQSFFENARIKYDVAKTMFLGTFEANVGTRHYKGSSFHEGGDYDYYELRIATGDLDLRAEMRAAMNVDVNDGAISEILDRTWMSQSKHSDGVEYQQTFRIEAGSTLEISAELFQPHVLKILPRSAEGDALIPVDNPFLRATLEKALQLRMTEDALTKTGFAMEGSEITQLSDSFAEVLDGVSIIDIAGRSSDGTEHDGASAPALTGTDGNDFINGKDYDDIVNGLGDDDVLMGGTGADTIDGGAGRDILYGGEQDNARDVFVFRNPETPDTVRDFERYILDKETNTYEIGDKIQIGKQAFHADQSFSDRIAVAFEMMQREKDGDFGLDAEEFAAGSHNVTAETRVYQDGGFLYYDADGSGTDFEAIHFATLENAGTLSHENFEFV